MLLHLGQVAVALIDLAHVSLVPAGLGCVLALLTVSRLGGPVTVLTTTGGLARTRDPVDRSAAVRSHYLVLLVAVTTACSAVVHAMAGPPHAAENPLFGVFFEVVAIGQCAWVLLAMVSPSRGLWAVGIATNAGLILLWLITRTAGLPFGLLDGPEAIGRWDLASKIWEFLALAGCLVLWRGGALLDLPVRLSRRLVFCVAAGSGVALLALTMTGAPT